MHLVSSVFSSDVDVVAIVAQTVDVGSNEHGLNPTGCLRVKPIEVLIISRNKQHAIEFG